MQRIGKDLEVLNRLGVGLLPCPFYLCVSNLRLVNKTHYTDSFVMRYLSSDLNLFRVLLTIYLQGNLTRAGKVLGVTQPAISNALARLRTMYDDPLFVRTGSRMRPTQKTEQIIQQVSIALELLTSTLSPDQPMPQAKD